MTELLIDIRDLSKHYVHRGRTIRVLDGLDLQVHRGEMCAIVGASGVGKSTFLNVVGTLDRPSGGSIVVDGEDVCTMSERRLARFRNRTIGFVFQFHHLLPEFTALENVMMPGLIQRRNPAEMRDQAAHILEEVGLTDRLTHKPGELSGGEQQRVALARALVLRPPLLLADEPTGNLDPKTAAGIHELFFRMNAEYHTTMLLVTHNLDLASTMPRTLELADGTVTERPAR